MTNRRRLANRRAHETVAIEHEGQRYKIGLGRELVCVERGIIGPIAEVFINAQKVNSQADVLASDGEILAQASVPAPTPGISGLILPPRIAPYQVVIIPIPRGNWKETVLPKAQAVRDALVAAGLRVMLDDRDTQTPGWKYNEWELRGVPLRLEIGPKDIEKSQVVLARRDTRAKAFVPMEGLTAKVEEMLAAIQKALYDRAIQYRTEHTTEADTYAEFKEIMDGRPGFVISPWCGSEKCEADIKGETQATIRNIPFASKSAAGKKCLKCDAPATTHEMPPSTKPMRAPNASQTAPTIGPPIGVLPKNTIAWSASTRPRISGSARIWTMAVLVVMNTMLAKPTKKIEPIHQRHVQIQDDRVWLHRLNLLQTGFSRHRSVDVKTFQLKHAGEALDHGLVVVHDENRGRRAVAA